MLGFVELFVAWLALAAWGAILSRRPAGPRLAIRLVLGVGLLLGVCLIVGFYGVFEALQAATPTADPRRPSAAPTLDTLQVAIYLGHGVVGLGYVAMLGLTAAWSTGRARPA